METNIVKQEKRETMSAKDIRSQVNLIQEVMKSVMQDGTHYGTIPGCPKPSLYKAGAEKIAVTFRIAVKTEVLNMSNDDHAKFCVTASAYSQSGEFLGSATGVCSSLEEKYKWRKPVCKEEFDETPENRKREKWFKGKEKPYKSQQIRTEAADIENTVLQMADKRAYVAVVRKVTAASDVFTQDIEDLPEGVMPEETQTQAQALPTMPKKKDPAINDNEVGKSIPDTDMIECQGCKQHNVTEKVYQYSVGKFRGKVLCFECQKKEKAS